MRCTGDTCWYLVRTPLSKMAMAKCETRYSLGIGQWYPNLIESNRVQHFQRLPHSDEITRVVEIQESPTKLCCLKIHSLSKQGKSKSQETDTEKSALPVWFPFVARSIDTFVDSRCKFRSNASNALVCLGRTPNEALPSIKQYCRWRR